MAFEYKNTSFDYLNGVWVIKVNGKWITQLERPVAFLPLLESNYMKIKDLAIEAGGDIRAFSIEDILVFALESESEYWQGLAIERASEVRVSERVLIALNNSVTNGLSQKNRHAAQRVLKSQ